MSLQLKNLLCVSPKKVFLINFEQLKLLQEYNQPSFIQTDVSCAKKIPHKNLFICGCLDGSLHTWDMDKAVIIFSIRYELNPIIDINFMSASSKFITVSEDFTDRYVMDFNIYNAHYELINSNQYYCQCEKYNRFSNCNRADMFINECLCGGEDIILAKSFAQTTIIK